MTETETTPHGLSIGIERVGTEPFLFVKAVGKLTHSDYKTIAPMIESAMEGLGEERMNVLFDASEMEGWEPRAAWDDFKLGLHYRGNFAKIAVYGDQDWLELASRAGSWFINGEMRFFRSHDEAVDWLAH